MRIISRKSRKEGHSTFNIFTIKVEGGDDAWNLYNLIVKHDRVQGKISRKVQQEGVIGTIRRIMTVIIAIEEVEYVADNESLHLKGKIINENQYLQVGQFQSMEVGDGSVITLIKKYWDSVYEERLILSCDPTHYADLAVVLLEEGLACIYLVAKQTTALKAKIEQVIPKRKGKLMQDKIRKSVATFFEKTLSSLMSHVDFNVVKTVVLGGPGYIKSEFYAYVNEEGPKKFLEIANRSNLFVLTHASSCTKQALAEILKNKDLQEKIADTSAFSEAKVLDKFYQTLNKDPNKAVYGVRSVRKAIEANAVDTIMVTDSKLKAKSVAERRDYITLIEKAQKAGAQVVYFSSLHPSGESNLVIRPKWNDRNCSNSKIPNARRRR
jgi:protein pelota